VRLKTFNAGHVNQSLKEKKFFKFVCGASFTDVHMIENLSCIFTLAGAHVIDLAPRADVILAARRGVEKAIKWSQRTNEPMSQIEFTQAPLLMASIQLDKDPHFRKIKVNYDACDLCGACIKICPTEAFDIRKQEARGRRQESKFGNKEFVYFAERCFGCGICPSYCHVNALTLENIQPTPKQTLEEMILLNVDAIEFHFGENYREVKNIWSQIKELVDKLSLISFSIGSELLSAEEIKNAANLCYKLAGSGIILQCDGKPMTGGLKNGNNMDKVSIKVAKLIKEENLPVYLQLSGGTTEKTYLNAINSGLDINGVAIGSHARKLLLPYIKEQNILDNEYILNKAVSLAEGMVNSVGKNSLRLKKKEPSSHFSALSSKVML